MFVNILHIESNCVTWEYSVHMAMLGELVMRNFTVFVFLCVLFSMSFLCMNCVVYIAHSRRLIS